MSKPIAQRFWNNVTKTEGCWIWKGGLGRNGYGTICVGPRSSVKYIYAHRFSYELNHGSEVDSGVCVCHRCDNRACVNPDHLFLGSKADNLRDMAEKGRSTHGEKSFTAKLTEKQAKIVLQTCAKEKGSITDFARRFGVSYAAIYDILLRRTWKHIG